MQETIDKQYNEYLSEKLDLIFNGNGGIPNKNGLRDSYYRKRYPKGHKVIKYKNPYDHTRTTYNYLDKKGKKVFKEDFKEAYEFHEGLALVGKQNELGYKVRYNFINPEGNYLSPQWFDDAGDFSEGYAPVKYFTGWNFIDHDGNLLFEKNIFADYVGSFHDGYALVRYCGSYNFIDKHGDYLFDHWRDFSRMYDYHCGRILVMIGNEYAFLDEKGYVVNSHLKEAKHYSEGYAAVCYDKGWDFIDVNGTYITREKYTQVRSFVGGVAAVKKGNLWSIIDTTGKLIAGWSLIEPKIEKVSNNITLINNKPYIKDIDLGDYKVKRELLGYQCTNGIDIFRIPFMPIKLFGTRYVLCLNKHKYMIFDMFLNKFIDVGNIENVEYDDNFIFDYSNGIVYLMYENQMIDITDYYNKKLRNKEEVSISGGVGKIISKDDFFYGNEDEIRERWEEERKRNKEIAEKQNQLADEQKIRELKEKKEQERKEYEEKKQQARNKIQEELAKLEELEEQYGKSERISVRNLFVIVGDHKEINPIYLENGLLKHIDLKGVSFKGVKICGIDFRGCNISLYPQEVYGKDLSGCNFEGIYIETFMDFSGVDIRGAKFSCDNNPMTIDGRNSWFRQAIYDETTTYNGISFVELYGECKITKGRKK